MWVCLFLCSPPLVVSFATSALCRVLNSMQTIDQRQPLVFPSARPRDCEVSKPFFFKNCSVCVIPVIATENGPWL